MAVSKSICAYVFMCRPFLLPKHLNACLEDSYELYVT